MINHKKS